MMSPVHGLTVNSPSPLPLDECAGLNAAYK